MVYELKEAELVNAEIVFQINEAELRNIIKEEIENAMDSISKRVEQYLIDNIRTRII